MTYDIKDINLAPEGEKKIKWVQRHMPVLETIKKQFKEEKPFEGITIGSCLHLEPKTINLGLTLQAGGAEVVMTGCNPLSTQDDATAAGAKLGLNMYGWTGETNEEYYEQLNNVLDYEPDIVIDDGADLIFMIHKERPELLKKLRGGCEETTTGIHRLKAMHKDKALKIPVMAVNDSYMKYLFDNRYGTGQSTFDSIMGSTNSVIAGQTVVVCGYGWCGRGIAMRADGLGANVIVTEVDPIRALEAKMDGYRVMTVQKALEEADIARGSFYQYFESKEDLLIYILKENSEKLNIKLKNEVSKTNGDIFKLYIFLYDSMLEEFTGNSDQDLFKQIFINLKSSDENIFDIVKNIKPQNIIDYYEQIDKTNLKIENYDDLTVVCDMLNAITRRAVIKNFKNKSKEECKAMFLKEIEYLKHGIEKKEEKDA